MRRILTLAQLVAWLLCAAAAVAQPAKDGNAVGTATSGTTVTLSATTTANPEIVFVGAAVIATGSTQPNLSIAGCSLSWLALGTPQKYTPASKGTAVYAWYATAASNLSACTVTVTSDQTIQSGSTAFCSFSGQNTSNPFDPNATTTPPTTLTNITSTSSTVVVPLSTNLAHDTMVAIAGQTNANMGGTTASSGATLCSGQTTNGALNFSNIYITYKTFTTPQTAFNIGLLASQNWWVLYGTALTADAPAGRSRIIQ